MYFVSGYALGLGLEQETYKILGLIDITWKYAKRNKIASGLVKTEVLFTLLGKVNELYYVGVQIHCKV